MSMYLLQFSGCPGIVLIPLKPWYFNVCQINLIKMLDDSNRSHVYCAKICEYVTEISTTERENFFAVFFLPHQINVKPSQESLIPSALLFKSVSKQNQ